MTKLPDSLPSKVASTEELSLENLIYSLTSNLHDLSRQKSCLLRHLEDLNSEISTLQRNLLNLETKLKTLRGEIIQLPSKHREASTYLPNIVKTSKHKFYSLLSKITPEQKEHLLREIQLLTGLRQWQA